MWITFARLLTTQDAIIFLMSTRAIDVQTARELSPQELREVRRNNAEQIAYAVTKLLVLLQDVKNKDFSKNEGIELITSDGVTSPGKIRLQVERVVDREGDVYQINVGLRIAMDGHEVATRIWQAPLAPEDYHGMHTLVITSEMQCSSEGIGLGTGILATNDTILEAVITSQPEAFHRSPTVTAVITDNATALNRENNRDGWTANQAKLLGYTFAETDEFYKVFPTRPGTKA